LQQQQQQRTDRRRVAGKLCIGDFPDLWNTFVEGAGVLFQDRYEERVQKWEQQQDPQALPSMEAWQVNAQKQEIGRGVLEAINPEEVLQALQDSCSQWQQQLQAAQIQHMGVQNAQEIFTEWQLWNMCQYSFPVRLEPDPIKRIGLPPPAFVGLPCDAA
jgi:hypothetical protein